jgi:mannose-6-phosphate isomerase
MSTKNNFYKLTGKIQHYQWGGYSYIPALLSVANEKQQPFAEYWLGAHVNAPAELEGAQPAKLNDYIAANNAALGEKVYNDFKALPYLLKILDVKDMLSIQVHPTKKAAVEEFAKENAKGVALNAPNRNYKDDNHKPELMAALSEFYLLHGFKTPEAMRKTLSTVPELAFLLPFFENDNYAKLYEEVMQMDQQKVNEHLQPLLDRIVPPYKNNELKKDNADFWAARAALTFNEGNNIDRGIFSVYLLNLVHIQPGGAIFQDAGILHAYLEGQNVEIMANSDNVLRGGLTPKHIDVAELMKHVSFKAVVPNVISGTATATKEKVFVSPAPDFQLSTVSLEKNEEFALHATSTEIVLVLSGSAEISNEEKKVTLAKGEAFVTFANATVTVKALENTEIYRAFVPMV